MHFWVEPLANSASISGLNLSNLLFPVPFGLPNFMPCAFLALSASKRVYNLIAIDEEKEFLQPMGLEN